MFAKRNRLRTTFDGVASLYDEVRPGYPEELFDDVVSLSGIPAGEEDSRSAAARARPLCPSPAAATGSSASSSARTWPRSPATTSKRTHKQKSRQVPSGSGACEKRKSAPSPRIARPVLERTRPQQRERWFLP